MVTVTAIAIGVVVVVIPIGAAATINTTIRMHCHCRHVWDPFGGVVIDDEAVVADAPVAPPLPPLGATDPMAAALTKTRDGTTEVTATATAVTAMAMEEEECDRCNGADPRRRLDDSLLRLADGILLHLIAVTMAPRRGGGRVWRPQQCQCLQSTSARCSLGGRIGRAITAAAFSHKLNGQNYHHIFCLC